MESVTLNCDLCKDISIKNQISSKCESCGIFLCENCERKHQIQDINGDDSEIKHRIISYADLMRSQQSEVVDSIKDLNHELGSLKKQSSGLSGIMGQLDLSKVRMIDEVNAFMNDVVRRVEEHRKSLIQNIVKSNEELVRKLTQKSEVLEKYTDSVQKQIDFLSEAKNSTSLADLYSINLKINKFFIEEVEEIKSHVVTVPTKANSPVVLKTNHKFDLNDIIQVIPSKESLKGTPQPTSADAPVYTDLLIFKYKTVACERWKVGQGVYQICLVNQKQQQLWCSVIDAIHVYSTNCKKVKEIKHSCIEWIRSICHTHNNDIIVACSYGNGLHRLDTDGGYCSLVMPGTYSSVCSYGRQLYVLDCSECSLIVMEHRDGNWTLTRKFKLNYDNGSVGDRVYVHTGGVHVSSWCNNCVFVYNHRGQLLHTIGQQGSGRAGLLSGPRMCGVDEQHNVLVADFNNNRIQVYDGSGHWHVVKISSCDISHPNDVIMDGCSRDVWIATQDKRLIKLSKTQA